MRQDLCISAWGEGIWQAAVKPLDQSPFPTAVAHHNNREGEREGKRDRDAEILEEDGLRLCWLAYSAYLPYFSKAHTEHCSIKHQNQEGVSLAVSVHPNGLGQCGGYKTMSGRLV